MNPRRLLLGVFDSQSTPNSLLGTRGGDDVGTVEGCCLNGGMRAIFLAWRAAVGEANGDLWVNLLLSRESPWATIVSRDPQEGRVDVHLRYPARRLVVRIPEWVKRDEIRLEAGGQPRHKWDWIAGIRPAASTQPSPSTQPAMQSHMVIDELRPGQTITIRYPLRTLTETVKAGGQEYRVTWRGDYRTRVEPESSRDHLYTGGFRRAGSRSIADERRLHAIRNPKSEIRNSPRS